jgi:tRNA U34 5-methylaminomethyl-2-thiouridine-forming methyltransferase MnmC
MKNRTLTPLKTLDGSYTLQYQELNEHYHSKDGAKSESEYVYIKNGLDRFESLNDTISVLEVGLGSGLNAVLTYLWSKKTAIKVNYLGLEPFPIENDIINFLNENDPFLNSQKDLFQKIHSCPKNTWIELEQDFNFNFKESSLENYKHDKVKPLFDVVFFDAFAPSRQEEVWSSDNILKCFDILNKGGVITSYCASGNYKRALKNAGFELIKNKGFGSKREMFIGKKI